MVDTQLLIRSFHLVRKIKGGEGRGGGLIGETCINRSLNRDKQIKRQRNRNREIDKNGRVDIDSFYQNKQTDRKIRMIGLEADRQTDRKTTK